MVNPPCKVCNKPVKHKRYQFCSNKCVGIHLSKEYGYYGKSLPLCIICGQPVKTHINIFCSPKCHGIWKSENLKGENHSCWKGGRTKSNPKYRTARWMRLSEKIVKRDNYECQLCSSSKAKIDVHHIYSAYDYPELFWEETNLITLCRRCHIEVEGTEWGKERIILPKYEVIA